MRWHRGAPRRQPAAAAAAVLAAGALIGLAACGRAASGSAADGGSGGQPPPSGSGPATQPAAAGAARSLCPNAGQVTRVTLRVIGGAAREMLPAELTITDAARARALAAALCALPAVAPLQHCPVIVGGAVRLEFAAGDRDLTAIRIQDSGCAMVTGAGPAREWSWSSRAGRLLSEAAGGKGRLVPGTHPSSVPTP